MKPRLLDLFCGAGGAAMGYARADFEVVGVDIAPQPHYPFEFHQADALTFPLDGFDVIHASPPCQFYSSATWDRSKHSDLYEPTRARFYGLSNTPWVIENVIGAPYRAGFVLCGSMFGLRLQRHRNFETSLFMFPPVCDHSGERPITISGKGGPVSGGIRDYKHSRHADDRMWGELMGMPWADPQEIKEAIPPAYTEWIGRQLLAAIERAA